MSSEDRDYASYNVAMDGSGGEEGTSKVLVIDDEPINCFVISALLQEEGIQCERANNGNQALEKIAQRLASIRTNRSLQMYKLIFLDYSMQGMDGPEVATRIRQMLDQANVAQPFICCCTAYVEE